MNSRLSLLRLRIRVAGLLIAVLDEIVPLPNHFLYVLHRRRKDLLLEHFAHDQEQPS